MGTFCTAKQRRYRMASKRKIIQIAVTQDSTNDPAITLFALCDDGTVWGSSEVYQWTSWKKLPPIPQSMREEE